LKRLKSFRTAIIEKHDDTQLLSAFSLVSDLETVNLHRNQTNSTNNRAKPRITRKIPNTFGLKISVFKHIIQILFTYFVLVGVFSSKLLFTQNYDQTRSVSINRLLFSTTRIAQQSFAMVTLYEYIGENSTTIVRNQPVVTQLDPSLQAIGDLEGFLTYFRNGQGMFDSDLDFVFTGNICSIVPPSYTGDCLTLAGGPGTTGIASLNAYVYEALSTAKSTFDNSNRTRQDGIYSLSLDYLIFLEGIFYRAVQPAYGYLYNILSNNFATMNTTFNNQGFIWFGISLSLIVLAVLLLYRPTIRRITLEVSGMQKLLKMMPKSLMIEKQAARSMG